jgi:PAS domain S-box-containing protein
MDVYRLAVEGCPSGMIVVDRDGMIVVVNGETERLFGYAREQLLGRSIELLLPGWPRSGRTRRAGLGAEAASPFGLRRDTSGRRKDGSEFPIELALNPLRAGGEIFVVGAVVDISERRRREKLQDELVSTVSHELRTPLTSIAASLGLLRAGSADSLPPSAAHLLEIAEANCGRLVRLVGDILDLKKLEAGQMPFHFARCEARLLLEQAIDANQGLAASCGVAISLEAPAQPIMLYVDPDRFIQLVTNLIANAVRFSPAGQEVAVALEKRDDNIRIGVRDHGPGIPAEFRPRVFEAFAQAHDGGGKGGSGLGLSIAQRIAAGMHGRIAFESAEGGGTVFYVDLPNAEHLARWQGGQRKAAVSGAG